MKREGGVREKVGGSKNKESRKKDQYHHIEFVKCVAKQQCTESSNHIADLIVNSDHEQRS